MSAQVENRPYLPRLAVREAAQGLWVLRTDPYDEAVAHFRGLSAGGEVPDAVALAAARLAAASVYAAGLLELAEPGLEGERADAWWACARRSMEPFRRPGQDGEDPCDLKLTPMRAEGGRRLVVTTPAIAARRAGAMGPAQVGDVAVAAGLAESYAGLFGMGDSLVAIVRGVVEQRGERGGPVRIQLAAPAAQAASA